MPEPISEQIVARIITDLKTIRTSGGYAQNVEVERGDETGNASTPTNAAVSITVIPKAPVYDQRLSYVGKDAFHLKVGILCTIQHSDESVTAVGTLQARVFADVHKVLGADRNLNGLCADAVLMQAQAGLDDKLPTADLELDVLFFTQQNNPYSL